VSGSTDFVPGPLDRAATTYVAGHRGMVGSAVWRRLEAAGFTDLCFCGVIPGAQAVIDFCGSETACSQDSCGGMGWVRLVGIFPSERGEERSSSCASPLSFVLEVGSTTCAPLPDSDGTPPGIPEQLEATRKQLAMMAAARRAIACCTDYGENDFYLGEYEPLPILGGCLGGAWTLTVEQ